MLERVWRKGNPPTLPPVGGNVTWKTVWRFLKKLKIKLPYDPAIPLLGIYPDKTLIQKDTYAPRISLVVQWLRLHATTAGGRGLTPGRGTEIPQAARCSQTQQQRQQKQKRYTCPYVHRSALHHRQDMETT